MSRIVRTSVEKNNQSTYTINSTFRIGNKRGGTCCKIRFLKTKIKGTCKWINCPFFLNGWTKEFDIDKEEIESIKVVYSFCESIRATILIASIYLGICVTTAILLYPLTKMKMMHLSDLSWIIGSTLFIIAFSILDTISVLQIQLFDGTVISIPYTCDAECIHGSKSLYKEFEKQMQLLQ